MAPPKFICWTSTPQYDDIGGGTFGKLLGHDDEVLENGISGLMKGICRELCGPLSFMWGYYEKMGIYNPTKESLPEPDHVALRQSPSWDSIPIEADRLELLNLCSLISSISG